MGSFYDFYELWSIYLLKINGKFFWKVLKWYGINLIELGVEMEKYKEIVEEVKNELLNGKKSHDWDHTMRVLKLAIHIGNVEKANIEIIKLAAILHDIGRAEQDRQKGKVCHAKLGALKGKKLMEKHEIDEFVIEKVVHCIKTHRFRGNESPESLEAKVLYDADKLDAIGAIGIGRAFLFAGEIGAKVHNKGVDISKTKSYTEEDTAYREYVVKLSKIKEKMLTKEGKRMAEKRDVFMREFFLRLDREVDGEI